VIQRIFDSLTFLLTESGRVTSPERSMFLPSTLSAVYSQTGLSNSTFSIATAGTRLAAQTHEHGGSLLSVAMAEKQTERTLWVAGAAHLG
jgi:hypothetical protein